MFTPSCSMRVVLLFGALVVLVGCGSNGGGGSGELVDAPTSLVGRTLDATVTSGSGAFATTGSFRVSFGTSTYALQGDGVNVANSSGTYTYTAVGSVGTAPFIDSGLGSGHTFAFTYTSTTTGNYSISGPAGVQAGTFVEL